MELVAAITDFLKAIFAFVPRREHIPKTHRGVKFINSLGPLLLLFPFVFWTRRWRDWKPKAVKLQPGITWWWPLFSEVQTLPVNRQVIKLEPHNVLTRDGKTTQFRGTVSYKIRNIVAALVTSWEVDSSIEDEAEAAFCTYVASKRLEDLTGRDREEVNDELTEVVQEQLKIYGVNVKRAKLSSLATGVPVLLIGLTTPTYVEP